MILKIINSKIKLLVLILLASLFILLILSIRVMKLKDNIIKVIEPTYIFSTDKLIKKAEINNNNISIVHNKNIKNDNDKVELRIDLVIGNDNDPEIEFYQVTSIIADKSGNIYVCEYSDCHIKKFDKYGNYLITIGKKGSGPGELLNPTSITFNSTGNICVIDFGNRRIVIFSQEGKYINSFRIPMKSSPAGFVIDNLNNYYLSYWDPDSDCVIHKYNSKCELIRSFGDPVFFQNL